MGIESNMPYRKKENWKHGTSSKTFHPLRLYLVVRTDYSYLSSQGHNCMTFLRRRNREKIRNRAKLGIATHCHPRISLSAAHHHTVLYIPTIIFPSGRCFSRERAKKIRCITSGPARDHLTFPNAFHSHSLTGTTAHVFNLQSSTDCANFHDL